MCIWHFNGVFWVALVVKRLPASAGEEGLIPGSGRSSREYEMIPHSSSLFKKKKKIYFNWRIITLKYCDIFLIHGHESAMGVHVFPYSEPRSHLPPLSIPWVVPEHQLWVSCFMHPICTGHLFYIWEYTCFNAVLSNHPALAFSHILQKSVLYICVSFVTLHIGSLLTSF